MNTDAKVLRSLAWRYSEVAYSSKNAENIRLHKAVNDLRQIRPVVLIDELPWHEMKINDELTLQCEEPICEERMVFSANLYKSKYMPADMVVPLLYLF